MTWFALILIILLCHSEILYAAVRCTRLIGEPLLHPGIAEAEALLRKRLKVFLLETPPLETMSLRFLGQARLLINQKLWQSLSDTQRSAVVLWLSHAAVAESTFARMIKGPTLTRMDRDLCVLSSSAKEWTAALEQIYKHRLEHPPTSLGAVLTGLSALGPGWLDSLTPLNERTKGVAEQLTKIRK